MVTLPIHAGWFATVSVMSDMTGEVGVEAVVAVLYWTRVWKLSVARQEFRVERRAAAIIALERAMHILERGAGRAGDRFHRERDPGGVGDVETVREQRKVLLEAAGSDRKLP